MAGYLPGLDTMRPAAEQQRTERSHRTAREAWFAAAVAEAAERQRREESLSACDKWKIAGIVALLCAAVAAFVWLVVWLSTVLPCDPSYGVAIDAVSGLTSNRTDLALHPAFNLTLRVTSESRHYDACVEPGTYVEVAYRCVTLAASATVRQRLCARPRGAAEQQLVATGTRVRVPGAVLDSLAADMRHGELVFQVTIRWSGDDYSDDGLVASCGGRQVGAADDDLGTNCDASHLCAEKTSDDPN